MLVTNHKFCCSYLPDEVAVYVAQVPPTNHVPPLIKQPVWVSLVNPIRYPGPDNVSELPVAEMLEVVFVTDIKVVLGAEVVSGNAIESKTPPPTACVICVNSFIMRH